MEVVVHTDEERAPERATTNPLIPRTSSSGANGAVTRTVGPGADDDEEEQRLGQLVEKLREVPAFHDLTDGEFRQIALGVREQVFEKGAYICKEGHAGSTFHVITEGSCRVTLNRQEGIRGEQTAVASLSAGDYFGEVALMQASGLRTANVIAETSRVVTLTLSQEEFQRQLRSLLPSVVAEGIAKKVGQDLRQFFEERVEDHQAEFRAILRIGLCALLLCGALTLGLALGLVALLFIADKDQKRWLRPLATPRNSWRGTLAPVRESSTWFPGCVAQEGRWPQTYRSGRGMEETSW